jgi:hypothetical protein
MLGKDRQFCTDLGCRPSELAAIRRSPTAFPRERKVLTDETLPVFAAGYSDKLIDRESESGKNSGE